MFNVRLAGGHLYGKQLFTWLSLVVSFMAYFVLSFFPLDVLNGIWDLIESVSEGFLTYSYAYVRSLTASSNLLPTFKDGVSIVINCYCHCLSALLMIIALFFSFLLVFDYLYIIQNNFVVICRERIYLSYWLFVYQVLLHVPFTTFLSH